MPRKSFFYLTCLFFFKIAVGAILLITGWDSLSISNNPFASITILMTLSFSPAAFARPLFKKFQHIALPNLLTFFLFFSSVSILIESFFIQRHSYFLYVIHFILWIIIFLIEIATEKWFIILSHAESLARSRGLSGISTSIGQIGIILGPLIVIGGQLLNNKLSYWLIFASFLISALAAILGRKAFEIQMTNLSDITPNRTKVNSRNKNIYILCFALIWPTLTIFNISIPILAKSNAYNSINIAGLLEIIIAAATASSGLLHSRITNIGTHKQRTLAVFLFFCIAISTSYVFALNLWIISISIYLLGLTFGYLRVELRAYLSQQFAPSIGGEIIAIANSWSALLVIIYSLIFYLNISKFNVTGLAICFPIAFFICGIFFTYLVNNESQQQGFLNE